MADDVAGEFPLRLSFSGTTAFDTTCRDIMASKGVAAVRAALRAFAVELAAHDDALEAVARAATAAVPAPGPAMPPALVPAVASGPPAIDAAAPAVYADVDLAGTTRGPVLLSPPTATVGGAVAESAEAGVTAVSDARGASAAVASDARVAQRTAVEPCVVPAPVLPAAAAAAAIAVAAAPDSTGTVTGTTALSSNGGSGTGDADDGTKGSKWNAGSFQWEERPLTAWATQRCVGRRGNTRCLEVPRCAATSPCGRCWRNHSCVRASDVVAASSSTPRRSHTPFSQPLRAAAARGH